MTTYTHIKKSDLENVFNLASEIWNNNYREMISQEQINYMLNMMYNSERIQKDFKEGYVWEYILHNDNIVGFLSYVIKEDNRVFLSKIYLKNSAQGLGIGKASLNRVINYAQKNNCNSVYLTVNRGNKKGVRAYKKSGFEIIAEEDFNIGNGFIMDDYIFEYKL